MACYWVNGAMDCSVTAFACKGCYRHGLPFASLGELQSAYQNLRL
ncbi:hypothetical protein DW66_4785 [Pseudomonas putida]|nr:hypothetical protein DW66_4785 [Pseudomonas putida]AJG11637.1 hypothetical protein RK21_00129 [Pseudomonas plecoglossicida]